MKVLVYTTHTQTEQPQTINHVVALTTVDGLLTIECDVIENGYTFTGHHRFTDGEWEHFEVTR